MASLRPLRICPVCPPAASNPSLIASDRPAKLAKKVNARVLTKKCSPLHCNPTSISPLFHSQNFFDICPLEAGLFPAQSGCKQKSTPFRTIKFFIQNYLSSKQRDELQIENASFAFPRKTSLILFNSILTVVPHDFNRLSKPVNT